jgi:hypothetical protein
MKGTKIILDKSSMALTELDIPDGAADIGNDDDVNFSAIATRAKNFS